jgi:hypothetical protein
MSWIKIVPEIELFRFSEAEFLMMEAHGRKWISV